ncbi:suppressor of cytokine signaling 2-like isoform X2 [Phthorimaea operculella]|nr:suppressor of cytokine signaling 2-like isoform X2 [Phthorimaea operculella]
MVAPDTCVTVGVPLGGGWQTAEVSCRLKCPNCSHDLQLPVAPHWCCPMTPQCTVAPTRLPLTPLCTPLPPQVPRPYRDELRWLADTLRALRLSGWYYGNLDWQGARDILKDAAVGSFVIRDSGDRNFIFSLSVQTERGPTSVRLHYEHGYFRLDCDRPFARYMARFRCVIELVQYYARLGKRGAAGTVWVDKEGVAHSPVLLTRPRRKEPPTLMHAARLAIHKALDSNPTSPKIPCAPKHRHLRLPSILIDYLGEYPYSI